MFVEAQECWWILKFGKNSVIVIESERVQAGMKANGGQREYWHWLLTVISLAIYEPYCRTEFTENGGYCSGGMPFVM